jgi:hypothetical protein
MIPQQAQIEKTHGVIARASASDPAAGSGVKKFDFFEKSNFCPANRV